MDWRPPTAPLRACGVGKRQCPLHPPSHHAHTSSPPPIPAHPPRAVVPPSQALPWCCSDRRGGGFRGRLDGNAVVESTAMSGDAASGTELNQEFLNTIEEAGLGDIAVEVGLVRGQPSSLLPPDLGHAGHLGAVHSMAMLGDVSASALSCVHPLSPTPAQDSRLLGGGRGLGGWGWGAVWSHFVPSLACFSLSPLSLSPLSLSSPCLCCLPDSGTNSADA